MGGVRCRHDLGGEGRGVLTGVPGYMGVIRDMRKHIHLSLCNNICRERETDMYIDIQTILTTQVATAEGRGIRSIRFEDIPANVLHVFCLGGFYYLNHHGH